jgi:hypothetical protein
MTEGLVDRRRTRRRCGFEEHGIVAARVRPGHKVSMIDVSAGGVLVETDHRLLPGTSVELHLETENRRATVRGSVLRCAIVRLRSSSVCYRGAVGFDRHLPWFVDEDSTGYPVPSAEQRPGRAPRAEATPSLS